MTIFTVIVTRESTPGGFQAMLNNKFEKDHLQVKTEVWLVAGKGSAKDMSDSLGISDASVATGIVAAMSSYYGRAPTNVWDWVKAKWEETSSSE